MFKKVNLRGIMKGKKMNAEKNRSGEENGGDPFDFSRLEGEAEKNKEFVITPDTKIDEIEANIEEYLKNDLALESNLLTYALKKRLDESPERLKEVLTADGVREKLMDLGGDHIREMIERIRNLETCETENYVFMLPKDKWEEGKTNVPNDTEGWSIASRDLTAIVRQPLLKGNSVVYNKDEVGKEVSFFCWDKDLLKAKKTLLEPNGYTIPKWSLIIQKTGDRIGSFPMADNTVVGYRIDGDNDFALWKEKLGLDCPGERNLNGDDVWYIGEKGYFWSDETGWKNNQQCLEFDKKFIFVDDSIYTGGMSSVRCVSCEKISPNIHEEDTEGNASEDSDENVSAEVANEQKKDAMENLKEQEWWRQTLTDFSDIIKKDLNDKNRGGYKTPIWMSRLQQTIHNGPFSYDYRVIPITSEGYNSRRSGELAQSDEKRFVIERNFGYARVMGQGGVKKNVGGFDLSWNPSFGDEKMLPEETDFTVENKAENEDIPRRINDAMYRLFSGFKYSSQEKAFVHAEEEYPDDETLRVVLGEFRSIIDDIGSVKSKIEALEKKRREENDSRRERVKKQEEDISGKLVKLIEKTRNGEKLDFDDLKVVYKRELDDNPEAIQIRQSVGVDDNTMRKMLNIK